MDMLISILLFAVGLVLLGHLRGFLRRPVHPGRPCLIHIRQKSASVEADF